jgi:anthraniloyl-CoA monooxygenase
VTDIGAVTAETDLLIGADGINSLVRQHGEAHFKPSLDWRKCRFTWLGTDKPLEAFTFLFAETEHGLFQVHAYPFEEGLGTWIVECREEVWQRAGLAEATEEETVAFCEELFADFLDGHRLFSNRSIWRVFPTVQCDTWHWGKTVLLGDAAHTAHFSIGSGTKLAMEDAIALVEAFRKAGLPAPEERAERIPTILQAYEDDRWVDVAKIQKAAQTSLEWFENSQRYMGQPPVQLAFNLMTRSKQITYENLQRRDPELVAAVTEWFCEAAGAPVSPPIFTPFRLRDLEIPNRIVLSPMCQYSAEEGTVGDWHLVHLGSRAIGGAGLLITEMTDVSEEGRISHGCAGIYRREHGLAWKRIVDFVHQHSPVAIGMQLAHAGRKASCLRPWEEDGRPLTAAEGAWPVIGPSAEPFYPGGPVPRPMDRGEMDRIRDAFVQGAVWAEEAGFDLVELHMAHGYLLSSFLSPLANHRTDDYGGSLENRMRYPLEVFRAVRDAWPAHKPVAVRISATDWMDEEDRGMTVDESVVLTRELQGLGLDVIDVSSAGNSPESDPVYGRMYQVPFAERIRHEVGLPTMAVGAILGADHANTVIAAGRADFAAMARPHLADAYLTLHAATHYEYWDQPWPPQYVRGKPGPKREPKRRR